MMQGRMMVTMQAKNEYPPISITWCAVVFLIHCVTGAALLAMLLGLVPPHEKIFRDFGTKIPLLTSIVISISRVAAKYWYWLTLPAAIEAAIVDALVLFGLRKIRPDRRDWLTAWAVLATFAMLFLAGLMLVAVYLPILTLLQNLSK
jgi:hypothetical protein